MIKIISVVGARPNFMKIAPFIRAIKNYNSFYVKAGVFCCIVLEKLTWVFPKLVFS